MARIYRDAYGVPHVRASDVLDLARAQGEVTARDRTWQLEHQRRRATGTVAEVLGPDAVAWDRFARRSGVVDTAVRAHDRLGEEARAFVAAYVEGVNAGLDPRAPELRQLGVAPTPWQAWTPLAVFLVQHVLFGSLPGKLWQHRAREVLGEDAALLTAEGPVTSGSNAWVVGGRRTASGLPLIGGDPHRAFESPGVYMQVRLACDGLDVAGFAFPGVPGVQHFAHAGDVAWAITNAAADYQDVFAERLRRVGDRVEALGPDGWSPVAVQRETIPVRGGEPAAVEVVTTPRGFLFAGDVDTGRGLSVRTASGVLGDLGFDTLLPLLRARSVADVDAALDRWVEPVNNVVVADRAGSVLYRVAGRVPVRDDANRRGIVEAADPATAWRGWVDPLPRTLVGPEGVAVTANERRGPESDLVGTTFAAPHRAARLHELVGDRTDLTAADFAEMHADTLLPGLARVRELLSAADGDLSDPAAAVRDAIAAWDGRMDADSAGAAAYAAWRGALMRRIADEPALEPLGRPVVDDPVLLPWLDPVARVGAAVGSLLAAEAPFGLDLPRLAAEALTDAAGHAPTWGATHRLSTAHAFDAHRDSGLVPPALPDVGVGGDTDCVRCTGSLPGLDDAAWRGSVARYVWDLADPGASGWVVPLGSSGDPASGHQLDQLPLWVEVELAPLVLDWSALTEESPSG